MTLRAPEYSGGRLGWDAFDVIDVRAADGPAPVDRRRQPMLATRSRIPDMPLPWFWEFDDAAVDFGDLGDTESDPGRLLLPQFALVWGNDWFHLPVDAPAGSLIKLAELLVTDTFGVATRI